jgi:hypothetical protein
VDAAVDAIIAPSSNNLNRRFNPICGQPRIVIQNRGATDLVSATITYGIRGETPGTYNWTGRLTFLEKETVILPALDWGELTGSNTFDVQITSANGGADEYAYNDAQFSDFETVQVFDSRLVVRFTTNNAAHENRWEVRDRDGNVAYSRTGLGSNRTYYDTLMLAPGCYEIILHDSGEDGISWWANNDGNGSFQFRLVGGGLWDSVNPDFGKNIRYPFRYSNLVAVEDLPVAAEGFSLYPNPADDRLALQYDLGGNATLHYEVYNMLGEIVLQGASREVNGTSYREEISTAAMQPGSYIVAIVDGSQILSRMKFNVVH